MGKRSKRETLSRKERKPLWPPRFRDNRRSPWRKKSKGEGRDPILPPSGAILRRQHPLPAVPDRWQFAAELRRQEYDRRAVQSASRALSQQCQLSSPEIRARL